MASVSRWLLLLLVLASGSVRAATGGTALTVTHSGYLLNGADQVLSQTLPLKFRVFDAVSGGTLQWEGTCPAVPVQSGYYTVVLGGAGCPGTGGLGDSLLDTSDLPEAAARWLEVVVDEILLSPRLPLGSVPVAAVAGAVTNGLYSNGSYADPTWLASLAGAKITGAVANAASAVSFSGSLAGDVTGTQGATTLSRLNGLTFAGTPGASEVLVSNASSQWVPKAASVTVTAGNGLSGGGVVALGGSTSLSLSTPVSTANGGTGAGSFTTNGLVVGNGTGALGALAAPGSGQVLVGSSGGAPSWANLSGDATLGSTGALTLAGNAVTYAKLQDVSTTQRLIGRNTAGAGDPEEVSLTQLLDWVGSAAQGDLLYRGSTGWTRLPAGTSGQVLQAQGAGANPVWATPAAGAGASFATLTASNSANLTFTSGFDASADFYDFELKRILPASYPSGGSLVMEASTNGGSSWQPGVVVHTGGIGGGAGGINGTVTVYNPWTTALDGKLFTAFCTNGTITGYPTGVTGGLYANTGGPHNAFRFRWSGGTNILSGEICVKRRSK